MTRKRASLRHLNTTPSTRLRGHLQCYLALRNSFYWSRSCSYVHAIRSAPPSNPLTLLKLLVATVTILDRPVPSYLDLRTGALFGNGGVEKEFHALPIHGHDRPPALPHATGGVIMSKLGNETAKYVLAYLFDTTRVVDVRSYRAALGRATWKLL